MQSNLEDVLNFELAKEDYDRISALGFQLRLVDGIRYLRPEGPYTCGDPSSNLPLVLLIESGQLLLCVVQEKPLGTFLRPCSWLTGHQ